MASSPSAAVLVTGASGLLGRGICNVLEASGRVQLLRTAFSRAKEGCLKYDLSAPDTAHTLISSFKAAIAPASLPGIVIHTAAERRPDVCESDPWRSEVLNIEAVYHLANAAHKAGLQFIHISTDYIFDGTSPPYKPESLPNPLNAYGRQKLRAEYAALAGHATAIILRVPVLYGPTSDLSESAATALVSFVKNGGKPCSLDHWQMRVPTHTEDIGKTLLLMVERLAGTAASASAASPSPSSAPSPLAGGIYHYSSDDCLTRYELVLLFAKLLGLPSEHVGKVEGPPAGAPRPRDAKLDCSKLKELGLFAEPRPLEQGLREVFAGAGEKLA